MSIAPSTMKCPACPDQMLETLSTPTGSFERCPNCAGLFIAQELVAAASQDRTQCLQALGEMNSLLLPADKWCPKCLQRLSDGRVRSRGVIFMLCSSCRALWTSLETLSRFEETLERSIRIQMDLAMHEGAGSAPSPIREASGRYEPVEDSGLSRFFRAFARVFDRMADQFTGRTPRRLSSVGTAVKPAKVKSPASPPKPEKKPRVLVVEPVPPAPEIPKPLPEAPSIDVPQFIFPKEAEVLPPAEAPPISEPAPLPEPTPIPKPVPIPAPIPEPISKSVPIPESVPAKALDLPQPKPKPGFGQKLAAFFAPKPRPKPAPKPVAVKSAAQQPQKALVKKSEGPGPVGRLFGAFKAAANPVPKKPAVKPVPSPAPKPIMPKPQAVKPVVPVKPPKVKAPGDGFFAKLFAPKKKPAPKIPVEVSSPGTPPVAPSKPVAAPPPKKPAVVKPKREKPPRMPGDPLSVWSPWAMAAGAVALSAFRDFGFEAGPAALWGIAGWSVGLLVRQSRLYPFKPFKEMTLQELSGPDGGAGRRRVPVILKGQIVLLNDETPKGEVVFKQDDLALLLNRLGTWDLIPRLFGLANPRQLLGGEVTVKGWYRHGTPPSLEVQEVRGEKGLRKSIIKSIRWAGALALLALALVITFSLE